MSQSLLFEIGVEELPASYVDSALTALPQLMNACMTQLRVAHGRVQVFGTPRRLAVYVENVESTQRDLDEEVIGPPEAAAFKDGAPTRAAEAFAQKLGCAVADLSVRAFDADGKQKAGRFLVGRKRELGGDVFTLLAAHLGGLIAQIPFRKSMRWGSGEATFGRPIQWLVALLGSRVIDLEWNGLRTGRSTRGHRFLAPQPIELAHADEYLTRLRSAHVIADREERTQRMIELVANAASAHAADYDVAQLLIDENVSLVETPLLVEGTFADRFLALPAGVIRAVARGHQRYFCLQRSAGELLPRYLAIVNTAEAPAKIAKGMNRVMAARLADAQFFFEEDRETPFSTFEHKLKGVVFHHRLGTVSQKVTRLKQLSQAIAAALGLPSNIVADCKRTAELCKLDLVSLMVGEFPELQGQMGRDYARAAGETEAVCQAIEQHYLPLGATDTVASGVIGAVVALADRVDTLIGCFAVGLVPSGSADPFALRRNCLAILRTLTERPGDASVATYGDAFAKLSLRDLLELGYATLKNEIATHGDARHLDLDQKTACDRVLDFSAERLRGVLATKTSSAVADAVLASHGIGDVQVAAFPKHAIERALALQDTLAAGTDWLDTARIVAKRLAGIAKATPPVHVDQLNPARDTDAELCTGVEALARTTDDLSTAAHTAHALRAAERLALTLDKVFRDTLVNDPEDPHTPARLALLSFAASRMLRIADFTRLGGAAN